MHHLLAATFSYVLESLAVSFRYLVYVAHLFEQLYYDMDCVSVMPFLPGGCWPVLVDGKPLIVGAPGMSMNIDALPG